jgi:hypothetical protein
MSRRGIIVNTPVLTQWAGPGSAFSFLRRYTLVIASSFARCKRIFRHSLTSAAALPRSAVT